MEIILIAHTYFSSGRAWWLTPEIADWFAAHFWITTALIPVGIFSVVMYLRLKKPLKSKKK